jgi:outer membrane murein-binding lipoprotein Lpp
MTTKLDDISAAIGGLQAEVVGLRRDLQASEHRAVESNTRADQHRAAIHRRVDDLVDDVGDLKTDVDALKADVVDAKAVTDEVKLWKQRGIGALFVAGIAGSAIGGTAVGFIVYWWDALMRLLRSA